ncbi:MAG: hypothetical protein K6E85_15405 [Lachnospiraceae bacterium]|nr:hypothetical protein [Lachnospiraceae bacterium]
MKSKRLNKIRIVTAMFLCCILACGCTKQNTITDITAVTPTQMGGADSAKQGKNSGTATPSPADQGKNTQASDTPDGKGSETDPTGEPGISPTSVDAGATPVATPTGQADDNASPADKNDGSDNNGTSATSEPTTSVDADPSGVQENDDDDPDDPDDPDDDSEEINEYWEGSFLVWLPRFKKGNFAGFDSDETHDFLTLENVSEKSVRKYIKTLTKQGFSVDAAFTDAEGGMLSGIDGTEDIHFIYSAENEDGWCAKLDYDPETKILTIGSGYAVAETTDVYGKLREETALGLIPEFTYGDFDSSKQEGGMYYAIFTNVTGKYEKYTDQLKKAGFVEEADEGNVDGIIWYNAYDAEGNACEFIYSDGVARIGCGAFEQ